MFEKSFLPSRRGLLAGAASALAAGAALATAARGAAAAPAGEDAELVALAADYAAANIETRRLEAMVPALSEDAYDRVDDRRNAARVRGAALAAATFAGMRAKAEIIVGELDLLGDDLEGGTLAELAASLARDVARGIGA